MGNITKAKVRIG